MKKYDLKILFDIDTKSFTSINWVPFIAGLSTTIVAMIIQAIFKVKIF